MTEKQAAIVKKYLNEKNLKKLEGMKFEITSSFIDMILQFRWYHPVCGEMCSIPFFELKPNQEKKEIIEDIEKIVNKKRKTFGLLDDEYASVSKVYYLDEKHKWYALKQSWYKGMSETQSSRTVFIKYHPSEVSGCSLCSVFDGIYNELFDIGIFSTVHLVNFFFEKAKLNQNNKGE